MLGASSPLFSTLGRGMGNSISPLGSSGAGQGMLPNASQGMAGAMPAQNSVGSGGGGFGGQGQGSAGGYPGFGSYAGNDMGIGTPLGGAGIGPLADAGQPGSAMASTSPGSNKKTPQGKSDIMPTVIVTAQTSVAKVAALTTRLQDESPVVRWHAVIELGKLSAAAKGAVPALAGRLQDKEESVRWAAALALGAIGPDAREAAMALRQTAESDPDPDVRQFAFRALQRVLAPAPAVSPDRPNGGKAGERRDVVRDQGEGPAGPALAQARR